LCARGMSRAVRHFSSGSQACVHLKRCSRASCAKFHTFGRTQAFCQRHNFVLRGNYVGIDHCDPIRNGIQPVLQVLGKLGASRREYAIYTRALPRTGQTWYTVGGGGKGKVKP
jgi:hypothetical protein